jgi:hypothetical protein
MIGRIIVGIAVLEGVISLGMWVGALLSMFRSKPTNPEDEERAAMRSLSWPTDDV